MDDAAFLGRDSGEAVAAELQLVVFQRHRPYELGVWTAMLHLLQIDIAAVGEIQSFFHLSPPAV